MPLLDLPDELLSSCCSTVDSKTIRLVCKRFALFFAQRLFSHLRLLPTPESARKAQFVLRDEKLSFLVTRLSIRPHLWAEDDFNREISPNPCWKIELPDDHSGESLIDDHEPSQVFGRAFDEENYSDSGDSDELEVELSTVFKRTINDIGRFPNLRRVDLLHTQIVDAPSQDPSNPEGPTPEAPESLEYRTKFFRQVLKGLNHPKHPALNVSSLGIRWMQDFVDVELATSEDFKAVMSRLRSLELSITSWQETQEVDYDITRDIELPELHAFFGRDLRKYWLEPLQDQLEHLELTGRSFWGYVPKCDLRGLHFPKLQSLVLEQMTFTHDWQLEWILSHGKTLTSLTLRDCPIIHATWIGHTLDDENYPTLTLGERLKWESESYENCNYWTYEARWHGYFERFKNHLPFLREIELSTWGRSWLRPALEVKPPRYCIFYSAAWARQSQVHEPSANQSKGEPCFDFGDAEFMEPMPWYPDCREQDQKALGELVETVRSRRQDPR
ncbi:hypothetical protein Q7P37_000047 [Cladosporium fusiforme]